jgi:hypothetical protein
MNPSASINDSLNAWYLATDIHSSWSVSAWILNLDCRLRGELDSFPKDAACEHPTMVGGTELDKFFNEIRPQQKRLVPSEVGVEEHVHRCPVGLDELLDCCCVDRHGFLFARARGA